MIRQVRESTKSVSLICNLLALTTPMGRLALSGKGARCPLLKPQATGAPPLWKPRYSIRLFYLRYAVSDRLYRPIAAVGRSRSGWRLPADFVEKLRISDVVIFRKEPVRPKSRMRFSMRHSEQPHERQKANLTEPFASKTWSRCTDKNLTDFVKNGVFQQYQPKADIYLRNQRREAALRHTKHHSRRIIPVIAAAPTAVTIQPVMVRSQRNHQRTFPHGPRLVEGAQAASCPIETMGITTSMA